MTKQEVERWLSTQTADWKMANANFIGHLRAFTRKVDVLAKDAQRREERKSALNLNVLVEELGGLEQTLYTAARLGQTEVGHATYKMILERLDKFESIYSANSMLTANWIWRVRTTWEQIKTGNY